MQNTDLNLKGGVLIIGSLFWQDSLGKKAENRTKRLDWRNSRLDMKSAILVRAPIRYGRLSDGGEYTMVFANSCSGEKLGTAYVVPFRYNPINDLNSLKIEATKLADAEGMRGNFIASKDDLLWSVLGILFNDKKIKKTEKAQVANWWAGQISAHADFPKLNVKDFKIGREPPCISKEGLLCFPWIRPVEKNKIKDLDDFDFVIATAATTKPTDYPSINKLAGKVKIDTKRKYLLNCVNHRIITHQDGKVLDKLR